MSHTSSKILFKSHKRTKKHRVLILLLIIFCTGSVNILFGQPSLSNYKAPKGNLSRSTGVAYNSIEFTGNAVPSWRYTGSGAEDDDRSYPINIGFDFWYLGTRYTTFSVSTNGFIDFSSSTRDGGPATNQYGSTDNDLSQPSTATTRTMPLTIAPLYYDQTTDTSGGGLDALGNGLKYLTSGTVGNRVLTVEWIRTQPWYSGANGRPVFNYQLKLYEGTGAIEFVYGYMNIGLFNFSAQTINIVQGYTSGMNGTSISTSPTATEILVQQIQNSTDFSHVGVNGGATNAAHNLQTLPVSNTLIKFSPPVPSAPASLSFPTVTQTSMQLQWTDSPDEYNYVIYRSDDGGASYNFITQLSANTTTYTQSGLLSGTTYYWRVYAVSEGALSSALTGSQATDAPGSFISVKTGLWSDPLTWGPLSNGPIPNSSSNVTISDGHTVTINQLVEVNSLTIGQGTSGILYIGNDATARTISVTGTIDVRSGGSFVVNPASSTTLPHIINTTGNIQNSGTFDMYFDADSRATVNFIKSGTQSISGIGATTRFHLITMNLGGSAANFLDVFATNFSSSTSNYLTITGGTFNLATGVSTTPFTGNVTIPLTGGLRVNHSSATLNTTGGNITVVGEVRVMNGTLNVGNAANNSLVSNGGTFVFSGGAVNVAGRFDQANSYALTNLTISGGTLTVNTVGSTSTTSAPFNMIVPGSTFIMSSGAIIVQNPGNPGGQNLGFINTAYTNYSITGGNVQIGNASTTATSTIRINSSIPVYNLLVNNSTVTAQLITNNLAILNNVEISSGSLNANALNITVGGNWVNNGTFTPGTGKVTFNGSGSQSITDPSGESFNKLTLNSSGTLTLINNVTVGDSLSLMTGTLSVSTFTLIVNGTVTAGIGTLTSSATGTVNYIKGTAVQNVLAANYGNLILSAFSKTFPAGVVGVAGNLTAPNPATAHVMTGNTIEFNGGAGQTIAATTANFKYNNLLMSGGTPKNAGGAITVTGNLTVGNGMTFAAATNAISVNGNISNAGSITSSGAGGLVLTGGSTAHVLSGGGSYQSLTMNDANGATLSEGITVSGTLTFTAGVISTNTDTVTVNGSVSRSSGHINGWLKKNVALGAATLTYEIGDAVNYTPATFVFGNVTSIGTLSVRTVNTEHPNINNSFLDVTNNVNRYWETRYVGLNYNTVSGYNLTLTYVGTDCDVGGNAGFRINWFNGAFWDSIPAGTRTTTMNQATGIDSLGSYAIGLQDVTGAYRTKASGNWTDFTIVWERFNGSNWVAATAYPKNSDGLISISTGHTVTVNTDLSSNTNAVDQVVIEAGGQVTIVTGGDWRLNNGSGTDLTIYGTLLMNGGIFSSKSGQATVTVGSGGVYQHNVNSGQITTTNQATTWLWDANATLLVTGTTTLLPASMNQTFGNVIWNCTGQTATLNLAGALSTINGTLKIVSTGTGGSGGRLELTSTQAALTINKNLIVSGGMVRLKNGGTSNLSITGIDTFSVSGGYVTLDSNSAATTATVNVSNLFRVTGGFINLNSVNNLVNGGVINISGNYSHTSGTIAVAGTGTASGSINFNGSSPQMVISSGTISGNVDYTVNSGAYLIMGTNTISGRNFTLSSNATVEIGSSNGLGISGNVQSSGTRSFSSGANYIFNGSTGAQVTGSFTTTPTALTVNKLTINNSAGVALSGNLTIADSLKLLSGEFGVLSQTLIISNVAFLSGGSLTSGTSGTVNYSKGSTGQVVLAANYGNLTFSNFSKVFPPTGTVGIAGTFLKGLTNPALHTITGSTIDFNGAAQTIPKFTFNNLTFSGSGTKTVDSSLTVNGTLRLSAGTLDLSTSSVIVTAKGNIENNATTSGSGKISLNGGSATHILSGSGTYFNLDINDALGAVASSNITVNGAITLTNGVFGMGTNTFIVGSSGTTVPGLGYVYGKIQKPVSASTLPQTLAFEVGDDIAYAPVSVIFDTVTIGGILTVSTTRQDHPNIKYSGLNQLKNVNRYWTLTSGISFKRFDVTLNFVAGDIDPGANTNAFFAKRYNSSSWLPATTVLRNSSWIKNLNNTGFGDFATGEVATDLYWTRGAGTNNWTDADNWSTNSLPTAFNNVIFDGNHIIDVNVDATVKNLTLDNPDLQLTIVGTKTLTISGNLLQNSGTFSTHSGLPSVAGSITFAGGTFGYDAPNANQTIEARSYYNLKLSGGGTKTAGGNITVNGSMTIGSLTSFDAAATTFTLNGDWFNSGTFIPGTSTIEFAGASSSAISGATTFKNIIGNKSSQSTTIMLNNNVGVENLTMTKGTMSTGPNAVTITGTRTGDGIIVGTISRVCAFVAGTSYAFEGPNNLITFNAVGTLPSLITQTVVTSSPGAINNMEPINRYYTLAMTGGTGYTFNYRLHYEDGEVVSPNVESTLKPWREIAVNEWDRMDPSTNNGTENWVEWNNLSVVGKFSLSSRKITNIVLSLTSDATNPEPGQDVTYTITYNNLGDENATNFLVGAPIPLQTTYKTGSLNISGTPVADDASGITIQPLMISINFNTLPSPINPILPGASGYITYKVVIN